MVPTTAPIQGRRLYSDGTSNTLGSNHGVKLLLNLRFSKDRHLCVENASFQVLRIQRQSRSVGKEFDQRGQLRIEFLICCEIVKGMHAGLFSSFAFNRFASAVE